MIDLPPSITASVEDRAETEQVLGRILGEDSVVESLAADLAEAIAGCTIAITAVDDVALEAAHHWRAALLAAGATVAHANRPDGATARIHLHGWLGSPYASEVVAGEKALGELVGEVIGQGRSKAARYSSLVSVADSVADALVTGPRPGA